ncbi:hypothetical protein ACHABQ_02905 [Nesterenkonia aurantiaca]|uniref:hypothetical protein n=1 Tax=Nesterenkonia aurantiaca TaxID=1436010 RepID=UPI003EE572CA
MGWEPTTTHQTDHEGRLLSSQPEPEWTEGEQGKMLALSYYEAAEKCPVCGGPKEECQDPDNENRYTAEPPVRCFYQTAVSREVDQWRTDDRRHTQALIPQVKLRE